MSKLRIELADNTIHWRFFIYFLFTSQTYRTRNLQKNFDVETLHLSVFLIRGQFQGEQSLFG